MENTEHVAGSRKALGVLRPSSLGQGASWVPMQGTWGSVSLEDGTHILCHWSTSSLDFLVP